MSDGSRTKPVARSSAPSDWKMRGRRAPTICGGSHCRTPEKSLSVSSSRVTGWCTQEFLDAYPPNVRLHLYPRVGPLDLEDSKRWTIELVWGDPEPDRLYARRWTSNGLGEIQQVGSVLDIDVDELWVREQFLSFVRNALDLD